jgi:hypothetical protein
MAKKIPNTEKDVVQPELSFIADWNIEWCNHFGELFELLIKLNNRLLHYQ